MSYGRGSIGDRAKDEKMHYDIGRIYTAKIKDNRDPDRNGRLRVWIKQSQFDEEDYEKWVTVRYAPPFWGTTPDNPGDQKSFESTKKSYGMWFVPPDLGNEVLICFIGHHDAFWFASVPEAFMNNMVPGIPSESTFGSDSKLPAAEYNRVLTAEDRTRPSHDPMVNGLLNQGLAADYVRGQTTSSARREAPSRSQGILTPRGHQIVIDDGWKTDELPDSLRSWLLEENRKSVANRKDHRAPALNPANRNSSTTGERNDELIRFRTRSGAQLLISETYGHIYMITRDGESWIELNNDGNIDLYGTGSFNVHTEQDINFRADNDINLEAGNNVNLKAAAGNIKTESAGDYDLVVGGAMTVTVTGNLHQATNAEMVQQSGGGLHLNSGGVLNAASASGLNLRSGADMVASGRYIFFNGPVADPANSADSATAPVVNSGVNIKRRISTPIFGQANTVVEDNVIETISQRVPTHEPFVGRGYEFPTQLPITRIER